MVNENNSFKKIMKKDYILNNNMKITIKCLYPTCFSLIISILNLKENYFFNAKTILQ